MDQSTQATAAGLTTDNVMTGRMFQFAPYDGFARLSMCDAAAGEQRVTVICGLRTVIPESSFSRQNRVPLLPDDILCQFPMRRGEQIIVKVRNTGAGSNTCFWRLDVRPR